MKIESNLVRLIRVTCLLALALLSSACTTCDVFRSMRGGDDMKEIPCAWRCADGRIEIGLVAAMGGLYYSEKAFVVLPEAELDAALSSANGPGVEGMARCSLPRSSLASDWVEVRAARERQFTVLPVVRRRASYAQDPELDDLVPSADSELTIFDLSGRASAFRSNEIVFAIARRDAGDAHHRFVLFTMEPDRESNWMAILTTPLTLPLALACDVCRLCLMPFGGSRG